MLTKKYVDRSLHEFNFKKYDTGLGFNQMKEKMVIKTQY